MRDYVRRLLAGSYEASSATNAPEALQAALRDAPDLALTEVRMLVSYGRVSGLPTVNAYWAAGAHN